MKIGIQLQSFIEVSIFLRQRLLHLHHQIRIPGFRRTGGNYSSGLGILLIGEAAA
ncbi:hypothetical protein D3C71_2252980 [compost metagenome]